MSFDIDGVSYEVVATPYLYNDEIQYKVSINGSEEILFAFDADLGRYKAEVNNSIDIPEYVAIEMGNHLNKDSKERQKTI